MKRKLDYRHLLRGAGRETHVRSVLSGWADTPGCVVPRDSTERRVARRSEKLVAVEACLIFPSTLRGYLRRPTIGHPVPVAVGLQFQAVKAYRTERIKNGVKFTCTRCEFSVSTLDFEPAAGNLRTQAATAINQHATRAHHEPPTVSSQDVELRAWRS